MRIEHSSQANVVYYKVWFWALVVLFISFFSLACFISCHCFIDYVQLYISNTEDLNCFLHTCLWLVSCFTGLLQYFCLVVKHFVIFILKVT